MITQLLNASINYSMFTVFRFELYKDFICMKYAVWCSKELRNLFVKTSGEMSDGLQVMNWNFDLSRVASDLK